MRESIAFFLLIFFSPLASMDNNISKAQIESKMLANLSIKFDKKYCKENGCPGGVSCLGHTQDPTYNLLKIIYIAAIINERDSGILRFKLTAYDESGESHTSTIEINHPG